MRSQRGMTLIEVLVALAILTAVVGSLLVLMGQHARQAAAIEDRVLARVAAENALTSYMAARREGQPADIAGEEEIGGRTFRFEIDREASPLEGFELVTSEVRLDRRGQVLASLTTLQPGERAVE